MSTAEAALYPYPKAAAAPLPVVELPLVRATPETFKDYGRLESVFETAEIDIVPWPQPGWRPLDPGTGDEGGVTGGTFEFWWEAETLRGRNNAVGGDYVLGWSRDPAEGLLESGDIPRSHIFLGHANYHPDGGQLFFPRDGEPFVAPLALPGDDVRPEDFVAFFCDGTFGINIHPGIWHEAVFPIVDRATFDGKQGRVHARISCDIATEFGVYLKVPLSAP